MLPEELAEKNGMTPEEAEAMAFKICEIGLMEFDRENPERRRQYFIPKWVVGSGEYMMMNSKLLKDHPEICQEIEAKVREKFAPATDAEVADEKEDK